jgi:hypothetical protein
MFWSQSGYRYSPPLNIDRSIADSLAAFQRHIDSLLAIYGDPLAMINLVGQTGRERKLAESFLEHILAVDNNRLAYFAFDFHAHCRALRYDRVSR